MNKDRRKAIAYIADEMGTATGLADLDTLADSIEALRDEEQEYLDNMPESFQNGDKGQAAESAIAALDEAAEAVREMKSQFDAAIAALETAQE
jgi:predicted  nucleic acid-binding Zn-ribbon protein